jgi:hypothetical protein
MTSTLNTTSTEMTQRSNTRNQASASGAGMTYRPLASPSRTPSASRRAELLARATSATEFILVYDGQPSYSVTIMEFLDDKVGRETQYFGDPFEPGPSRAQWVERIGVKSVLQF